MVNRTPFCIYNYNIKKKKKSGENNNNFCLNLDSLCLFIQIKSSIK